MRYKLAISLVFCLVFSSRAGAQFFTEGSDPGSLKWSSVETANFRVIYPRGSDSLARLYARSLESVEPTVGASAGFRPNQTYGSKLQVVLHPFTASANGLVTWAPRRMELFTVPDASSPEAQPWNEHLTIHESRHASQMQFSHAKPFRFWNGILGELVPGALSAVYCGPAFLEGDAVMAETALTRSGRGRSADFLEYYRASFADGDYRNYWRWRWGSSKRFTPDHYTIGYMMQAGIRTEFDCPDFTERYYRRIADHGGVTFLNFQKTIRDVSGLNFKDAFVRVADHFRDEWAEGELARGPFMPSVQLTAEDDFFPQYNSLEVVGENIFAVKTSLADIRRLVRIGPAGKETRLATIGSGASSPQYSIPTGRLYWSEYRKDPRWELRSYSNIRWTDSTGRTRNLTKRGRYYNPMPSPDEKVIAANEYDPQGGTRIVLLDAENGTVLKTMPVPEGLQITELAWTKGGLRGAGLDKDGFAIYEIDGFKRLVEPLPAKINHLWSHDGNLMFTSDRSGVNELYRLSADGSLSRVTSTRFGGRDYRFSQDGSILYHTEISTDGRHIHATETKNLPVREVAQDELWLHPTAERLSLGETAPAEFREDVEISAPKNYSKLGHLLRLHSWAPVYFDYDAISKASFETLYKTAGLGVTGLFQNTLGTAWGSVGYHAQFSGGEWRHTGHLKFTYAGLYPVFELSASVNTRDAVTYRNKKAESAGKPLATATLSTYMPLSTSVGGWTYGFIPTAKISVTNDRFEDGNMSRVTATARAYAVQSTPSARLYPRLGIGGEVGYSARPWAASQMCSNLIFYLYGYLPGFYRTHGIRLSAIHQRRIGDAATCEAFAAISPRGFPASVTTALASYPHQTKIGADYAFPFAFVDWGGLGPVAYVKNFEFTAHGDFTIFGGGTHGGNLASAGADLCVRLGNLLWIPFPTRIGISYNCNFGKSYDAFRHLDGVGRHDVSFLFGIDL